MTRKHNYKKKIQELVEKNKLPSTPGVYILHIYHDDWCNFLKGGECNCNPNFGVETFYQKGKDQQ